MLVQIDLKHVKSKMDLLKEFGDKLELGGPNGNVPVTGSMRGRGWGLNWDALNDSLCCLDSGGIWGTSKRFEFPLKLVIMNHQVYLRHDPEGFRTLVEILEDVKGSYSASEMLFEYELA